MKKRIVCSICILAALFGLLALNPGTPGGSALTDPGKLAYAMDIGGNRVAVVSDNSVMIIDDANLLTVDKGYVYYRSGTQLRRMHYKNSGDVALVDKDYGYNTGSMTGLAGTPYYYSYVYNGYVELGETAAGVLEGLPGDLVFCGDKYASFEYDPWVDGGTLYYYSASDFSVIESTGYKCYYNRGIALNDSVIFKNQASPYETRIWYDLYDYKTKRYTEKAYQIPEMMGFAEFEDVVSEEVYRDYIIQYVKYRDGSKDVYYALFFNSNDNLFTLSSGPVRFGFIMNGPVWDAGGWRFGVTDNKLCKTDMEAFVSNQDYDISYVTYGFNMSGVYVFQDMLLALSLDGRNGSLYSYDAQADRFENVSTAPLDRVEAVVDRCVFFMAE